MTELVTAQLMKKSPIVILVERVRSAAAMAIAAILSLYLLKAVLFSITNVRYATTLPLYFNILSIVPKIIQYYGIQIDNKFFLLPISEHPEKLFSHLHYVCPLHSCEKQMLSLHNYLLLSVSFSSLKMHTF